MENTIQRQWTPWLVVFSASLFFLYQFAQMNIINSLAPHLMQTFSIDATHLGKLSASYFYATLLFFFLSGQILDRFSTRKVILTVLLLSIFGTFSFALSPTYSIACLARFITGIGDAFCFLSAIRIASGWFPNKQLALAAGLMSTMGMIGATMAQTPLALLIHHFDNWRYAIMVDGLLGFICWILIYIAVRDYPPEKTDQQYQEYQQLQQLGYWRAMRTSYGKIRNWLCGLYNCFMALPIFLIGGDGFGSLYLQQVKHMTPVQASYPPMMIFIGMAIGAPLAGWISDTLGRRKLPMQFAAIISIGVILCIIYTSPSLMIYTILFFLLGLINSAAIISYSLVTESNAKILTATSISIVSLAGLSGGAIFPHLFGYIMDKMGNFKIIHNIHVYNAPNYHHAMWIMPITLLVALIATFFIRETYCQASSEH